MLSGWENYRHQADVCHAYQVPLDIYNIYTVYYTQDAALDIYISKLHSIYSIYTASTQYLHQVLHSRGVADDNIIVMMYDDISEHSNNTRPGTIINTPGGQDVYAGVPRGEGRSL